MKFIDLFGGIGGFRLGIQLATNWDCVWYCDKDKFASSVYNLRFNEKYEAKDIRQVQAKEIPEHDCICAGFPCQSFSVAGQRRGLEDTRGTLFFEICRIAGTKKPKLLFLENVRGLLSHDKGETFRIILESLWNLGYDVEWQVLNSKRHGVPQNRERVFIIGHLGGFSGQQVFPFRFREEKKNNKQSKCPQEELYAVKGDLMSYNNPRKQYGINSSEMYCLRGAVTHGWSDGRYLRKISPVEAERLQGFPDCWTSYGIQDGKLEKISDTQRYKMLGNAVTVNVIKNIAENLAEEYI